MAKPLILCVDDRETNRYTVTRQLQRSGFDVIEASTGEEALQQVRANPDLVLLDVNLPDMSGFDVCQRIKTMPSGAVLPVVMLSGTFVEAKDQIEGLEGGADAYLTQPIDFPVLTATIRALLRARQAEHQVLAAAKTWQATFDAISDGICIVDVEGRVLQFNLALQQQLGKSASEIEGNLIQELIPALPLVPAGQRKTLTMQLGERWLWITCDPVFDNQAEFHRMIYTIRDITEVYQQRVMNEALRDTASVLSSTLNVAEVLDRILDNIGQVIAHETADIMLLEGDEVRIVRSSGFVTHGLDSVPADLKLLVQDNPLLNQIYETGEPLILSDSSKRPNWLGLPNDWLLAYAGLPITWQGEVIGFLNVTSTEPGYFTPEKIDRLTAFAYQAATAIQNARLYEQAKQSAALEERARLSRDLHDAVSQLLFSSSTLSEALTRQVNPDPVKLKDNLERLHWLNRGALAEMRTLLIELRLNELKEIDLNELLQQLADSIIGRTRLKVRLHNSGKHSLSKDIQIMMYRIAQEALNNIIKHSQATDVLITLTGSDEQVSLSIEDNGAGFDPEQISWKSMGLTIMRERAAAAGLALHISSKINAGTRVLVRWQENIPAEFVLSSHL